MLEPELLEPPLSAEQAEIPAIASNTPNPKPSAVCFMGCD
jgi:hypothetical protein